MKILGVENEIGEYRVGGRDFGIDPNGAVIERIEVKANAFGTVVANINYKDSKLKRTLFNVIEMVTEKDL